MRPVKIRDLFSQRTKRSTLTARKKKSGKKRNKEEKSERSARKKKSTKRDRRSAKRKSSKRDVRKEERREEKREEERSPEEEQEAEEDQRQADAVDKVPPEWLRNPPSAEQKAAFEAFANDICSLGIAHLIQEFTENIKPYLASNCSRTHFDNNVGRNRYRDVICNDATRVVLKDGKGQDYIHANWVRGDPLINEFICTQGPLPQTSIDFWRMIAITKCSDIIMLCDVIECGNVKCETYWPTKAGEKMTFRDITVENMKILQSNAHFTKTRLNVRRGDVSLLVTHHFWKTWPDRSVPRGQMCRLLIRILREVRFSPHPTVVHCSAGIGRTGTLVAVEMCLMSLLGQNSLNLQEVCKKLRDQRMHSIQVEIQYCFLAITVLGYGIINGYLQDSDSLRQLRASYDAHLNRLDEAHACPRQIHVAQEQARAQQQQHQQGAVARTSNVVCTGACAAQLDEVTAPAAPRNYLPVPSTPAVPPTPVVATAEKEKEKPAKETPEIIYGGATMLGTGPAPNPIQQMNPPPTPVTTNNTSEAPHSVFLAPQMR